MKTPRLSRRALLAVGAGASLAPLDALAFSSEVSLVTHASSRAVMPRLQRALEAAFAAAGRPTRVKVSLADRHAELQRLARGLQGDVLVFDGPARTQWWKRELSNASRVVPLSLGASVDPHDVVAAPLWQALWLGARWAGRQWGSRFAVLADPTHACTDLPLVARAGLEAAGVTVSQLEVVPEGRSASWGRVDGVIALGVTRVPASMRALTLTAGAHFHVGAGAGWLESLASRTVARLTGVTPAETPLTLTTPDGDVTTLGLPGDARAPLHPLTLRNGSAHPFSAC